MKRNILLCLLVLLLAVPVTASDQTGTITVNMLTGETFITEGEVTAYFVGTVPFRYESETLSEQNAEDLAQELAEHLEDYAGTTRKIDDTGRAVFSDLEPGVYLLIQDQTEYEAFSPFLVTLKAGETVETYPKIEITEEPESTPTQTPTTSTPSTAEPMPTAETSPTQTPGVTATEQPVVSEKPTEVSPIDLPVVSSEPIVLPIVSAQPTVTPSDAPAPTASPAPEASPSTVPAVSAMVTPSPSTKTITNPFTGDEIDLRFWTALVGACLIALALILLTDKRHS